MNNMKPEGICDVQMSTMAKRAPRRVCGYVIYFLQHFSNMDWNCFTVSMSRRFFAAKTKAKIESCCQWLSERGEHSCVEILGNKDQDQELSRIVWILKPDCSSSCSWKFQLHIRSDGGCDMLQKPRRFVMSQDLEQGPPPNPLRPLSKRLSPESPGYARRHLACQPHSFA